MLRSYSWYSSTMVRTFVHVHYLNNDYEKPKALRCNGETRGRCQHRHHGILRFQLDSDVCSADLHHNARKHVGLHALAVSSSHGTKYSVRTRVRTRVPKVPYEEGESSASTRARRNLSSAVHYWNAAATISCLRAALLVQLPTS